MRTCSCTVLKKQVPLSMAIGNDELMHECFQKHWRVGTAKIKYDQVIEEGKKREMSMEISKEDTKEKKSPDGLNYPNQNTKIINIICLYFTR